MRYAIYYNLYAPRYRRDTRATRSATYSRFEITRVNKVLLATSQLQGAKIVWEASKTGNLIALATIVTEQISKIYFISKIIFILINLLLRNPISRDFIYTASFPSECACITW